jgi:hypothetical protein
MHMKQVDINTRNCIDSAQDRDYLESSCECGTDPASFISHEVIYYEAVFCYSLANYDNQILIIELFPEVLL